MAEIKGKVIQVIGPVVDITFEGTGDDLPNIHDALEIQRKDNNLLIVECQQHIGENTIRCIAMDSTDGLTRGMEALVTGSPIKVPVGEQVRGRLVNVIGDAIDGIGELDKKDGYPVHRKPRNTWIFPPKKKCCIPVLK